MRNSGSTTPANHAGPMTPARYAGTAAPARHTNRPTLHVPYRPLHARMPLGALPAREGTQRIS